jgi:hypothetical protein
MASHGVPDAAATPTQRDLGGVHLSWVRAPAASSCPDAAHVEADVTRRLGVSPFSGPPKTSLEVTVSRSDALWKAEIEMRGLDGGSTGSRTVTSEAATCASLTAAAGLAIALMINPDALLAPDPPAVTPPASEPVSPEPKAPVLDVAPKRGRTGELALSVVAAARVLPQISAGIEIRGEVAIAPRTYASLSGLFLPEQQASRSDGDVRFGITWATLGPCYRPVLTSSWELGGCASLVVGAMHVVVATPTPDEVGQRFYWGAAAGARLSFIPWPGWDLLVRAEALAPLNRKTFVIQHDRPSRAATVFAQPAVGALFSAGLGIRF